VSPSSYFLLLKHCRQYLYTMPKRCYLFSYWWSHSKKYESKIGQTDHVIKRLTNPFQHMISLIANRRLVLKHRSSNNMRSFEFINRLSRSTWHVKRRSTLQYILFPVLRVYALLCFSFFLILFDLMFTFVRHVIETPSFQSQYTYFNSYYAKICMFLNSDLITFTVFKWLFFLIVSIQVTIQMS
jgi:hypothetical protein